MRKHHQKIPIDDDLSPSVFRSSLFLISSVSDHFLHHIDVWYPSCSLSCSSCGAASRASSLLLKPLSSQERLFQQQSHLSRSANLYWWIIRSSPGLLTPGSNNFVGPAPLIAGHTGVTDLLVILYHIYPKYEGSS
jgi:hypothetical protein